MSNSCIFISGKKAYLHDRLNTAWLPTLHLGTGTPASTSGRYDRTSQRKQRKRVSDAVSSLLSLKKKRINFDLKARDVSASDDHNVSDTDVPTESDAQTIEDGPTIQLTQTQESQTDLTSDGIRQLEEDLNARVVESSEKQEFLSKDLYSFAYYEKNTEKVSFYTGMPNIGALKVTFEMVEAYMRNDAKALSKENEYLLCLIKLRMNYLFKDIANHLNLSAATVQRSFHDTLDVLFCRLCRFLIRWPDRENLRESMPMCFRKNFGCNVVVILDCFELFTERPSGALNKVYTYSSYKHHQTVKYLIGVSPQGVVTYISEGWGGRTSDKYITEKCGILNNLLPGDTVMVDRGFNIEESVNFYQANLAIPNFTKGKSQLHPLEVEKTRKIAAVRIHVERVIGLLLRKFRIFEGIVPLEFLKLRSGEQIPTIDKIVHVACAIVNLSQSIVPFE